MAKLPEEIKPALEAGNPAAMVTCSADGTPNVTYLSKIYWVDDEHLAVSFQFFSKTKKNISENPHACFALADIPAMREWHVEMEFVRSETEGKIFDEMDMAIEAIASMTGMAGIFKLQAADIYKVHSVKAVAFLPQ